MSILFIFCGVCILTLFLSITMFFGANNQIFKQFTQNIALSSTHNLLYSIVHHLAFWPTCIAQFDHGQIEQYKFYKVWGFSVVWVDHE